VSIVRYAHDFVMGFEVAADARRMLAALKERLAKFGLSLHEDKTRLIEFGRLPALARRQRGEQRPGTFAFLGFTHYCGWTRDGRFIVKRKTQSKRLTRKLKALRQEAWRHMHAPLAEQHRWLSSVLRGHYGYYGVPHNYYPALNAFHQEVRRIWRRALRRRTRRPSACIGIALRQCSNASLCPCRRSLIHGRRQRHDPGLPSGRAGCGKAARRICEGEAEWLSYSTTTCAGHGHYVMYGPPPHGRIAPQRHSPVPPGAPQVYLLPVQAKEECHVSA
jgi:hypothetical protein